MVDLKADSAELMRNGSRVATRSNLYISALLFFCTAAIFCRATTFGFVNYDDSLYVYGNPYLRGTSLANQLHWAVTGIVASNYHPVTLLFEVLIARTFGTSARGFHVCSILFHASNVALLFLMLEKTTRRVGLAVAVAVLWGWHPLRVESVAWVSELKDPLSTFFWLLALLQFARFTRTRRIGDYTLVLLAAVLACGSKPMAVTLPVTMLLMDVWPLCRLSNRFMKLVIETLPVFAIVAIFSVSTWFAQRSVAQHLNVIKLSVRIENAILAVGTYIKSTILPTHLAVFYPHPGLLHHRVSDWWIISACLIVLVSIVSIVYRRRWPVLFFGWFWYLATLVPVIGIIQVGEQARADRYTYVPTIGLIILAVWALEKSLRLFLGRRQGTIETFVVIPLALLSVGATELQLSYWKDTRSLFEHALRATDDNHLAMDMVAIELLHTGENEQALELARRAYLLRPRLAGTSSTLGQIYDRMGLYDKAAAAFGRAVMLTPNDSAQHDNLGATLAKLGNNADAEKHYREAIRINPSLAGAHANLGLLLASRGDIAGAVVEWRTAVRFDPLLCDTFADLGRAEAMAGDDTGALADYRSAIVNSSKPASEWLLSAAWLAATSPTSTSDDIDGALLYARRGVALLGTQATVNPIAYDTLGAALARQGDYDNAISAARVAIAAHPTPTLGRMIQQRLDGYIAGKPFIRPRK